MNNQNDVFNKSIKSNSSDNNFFISENNTNSKIDINIIKNERQKRLNDYDFNLLKEGAYKDISDDLFKLEYKISKIEEEIAYLSCQIQSAKEINDLELLNELVKQKNLAQEDYEALIALYNNRSLSARVSESISSLLGDKLKSKYSKVKCQLNSITNNLLSKLPKRFSTIIELKKSLNKLENINKSVDELMTMNIPFGENINKYEQLSKYIIKANEIQGELSKYIKK